MKLLKLNLALTLFLLVSIYGNATTITVTANHGLVDNTDGVCSISEAIINANDDAQTHADCPAGSGSDSIELTQDVTLNIVYENDTTYGSTGTPLISTAMILDGKGFALQRDSGLPCVIDATNTADEFRILRTTGTADLSLLNITIANGCTNGGRGDDSDGGGLHNRGNFLSLQQVTFKQNKARADGGAINLDRGTISLIRNSLFVGNTSFLGGAIAMNESTDINTIENSTFSNNAGEIGSAISNVSATINTIQNTTFSNNSLSQAIYNFAGIINNLQNTLFHNNTGNSNPDCRNFQFGIINGSNNITTHPNPSPTGGCSGFIATVLDPLSIGDLSDNGGATMTHALLAGSQALDAGDGNSTTSDQRGFGLNGVRDIGAFEAQPIDLCPMSLMTDGFTTTVGTADDLIQAIECSNVNGNIRDLITLSSDITLTSEYENVAVYGRTGTPAITTALTIDGNGFVLQRDSSIASEFRLLRTTTTADVIIDNIELVNGLVSESGSKGYGGALLNQAKLHLRNTILRQNNAIRGAGVVHNGAGTSNNQPIISNTLFNQNSASNNGSDLYVTNGVLGIIESSTFSQSGSPSSVFVNNANIVEINNATFSMSGGTSILQSDGGIGTINNSTFVGSTAALKSNDIGIGISGSIANLNNNIFKNTIACTFLTITNANNNLADAITTCDGTTVGNAGVASNISITLADNSCTSPLPDGSCLPTHALLVGSNAINASTTNPTSIDGRGFNAEGIRDIGAFETHIPLLTAPADVVAESTGATTVVSLGTAIVSDVDETGLIAIVDNSGPFTVGMTTVNWSVTDSQGFSVTDTQVVNVQAVIAGTVNGLNGTVTLQNTNMETININANGNFRFTTALDNLSNYAVTVSQQPATQHCVIANSSGQVNGNNISDIIVTCTDNILSLSSSTLDFGLVFTGENSTQTVTLTNNGTGDVTIASFTNPNMPFGIVGGSCLALPITLLPTESCDFIVAFNPITQGNFDNSFDVISNAASSPTTINLTGSSAIRIIPTLSFYGLMLLIVLILAVYPSRLTKQ